MLVLYYDPPMHVNFIRHNVSINIKTTNNLPLDLPDIILIYGNYVKAQFIDTIQKSKVSVYSIIDKFQLNFVSNILIYAPYNKISNHKNKTIIHKLLLNYMKVKNDYDKYLYSKIFIKFIEIAVFSLFKELLNLDKDDYIILIFGYKKNSIDEKVLSKIIKVVKDIMYKSIDIAFLLLYVYALFTGRNLINTYGLYKVLNKDLIFMSYLSIYKDSSKNKFATIFVNDEIELYIGKSKKTEIEMLEIVKVVFGNEEVAIKPIRYSKTDNINTSLISMKHITKVLSKSFELTSLKKFIEEALNLIDKKNDNIRKKNDLINILFSSLLGLSLAYSNRITKVYSLYSFGIDIHYFVFSPLETFFIDKINNNSFSLLDFDLIVLPQELRKKKSIKNAHVCIDIYSADLSFISENSFFIFPIIRLCQKDIETPYITENQKSFDFNILDKKMVFEIHLEGIPTQIYMEDVTRRFEIKILYSLSG